MRAIKIWTDASRIPAGDFVSEGLSVVLPDACFPNMIMGDKAKHPWPYLRREIDHNWYCDRRVPLVGFLSRDEAILLHNLALQFRNKPGLEIGCWTGWSTCHLALAGLALDVVDPILAEPEHLESVRESLTAAAVLGNVRLYATSSPDGVRDLAKLTGVKWNFFFIDGDHEGTAPIRDAEECLEHAAEDAMIVFHDLTCPAVEKGLQYLWRKGWNVLIYQTMQIVGVAWRGSVKPVEHKADPTVDWTLPAHLTKYPVSGASPDQEVRRLSQNVAWHVEEINRLEEDTLSLRTVIEDQQCEIDARDFRIEGLRSDIASKNDDAERKRDNLSAALADREIALKSRGDELISLQNQITAQENKMHEMAAEFERAREFLTIREEELSLGLGQTIEKFSHISHLASETERFSNVARNLSAEVADLQSSIELLSASFLSRITKPVLRAAAEGTAPGMNTLLKLIGKLGRQTQSGRNPEASGFNRDQQALFDPDFYCEMNPDVAQAGVDPFLHYITHGAAEGRDPHPLFDTSFYCEMNRDVTELRANPLLHYVMHGAAEGRDPHPLFDTSYYFEMNPDVREKGLNPLLHFMSQGADEGKDPHPLFSLGYYREMNPDVDRSGMNPLIHFINIGAADERDPHPLFSVWFYRQKNPEVNQTGIDPLAHYLRSGIAEDRIPHPLFDPSFYCEKNPEVRETGIHPLLHYVMRGAAEGRNPHPLFDTAYYWEKNPDVATSGTNPLIHYLTKGAREGRNPHPLFDTSFHVENNEDVAQEGVNPLWHFAIYGAKEDRDPHPMFDTSFYREQNPQIRDLEINPLVHFLQVGPTMEFDPFSPTPTLPDTGVCIVTPDIVGPVKNGGIGTACYHFARVLVREGHPVSIFFAGDLTECQKAHWRNTYARSQIKFIALSDTAPCEKLVYGSTWFYERSWRIFEYLQNAHYSAIHFQDWQANGFWSFKAKQVGMAFEHTSLTLMAHSCTRWINEGMQQFGAEPLETAKLIWAETYCMEHCDALLSPSRYMIEWARDKGIELPQNIRLTPYAWSDGMENGTLSDAPVDNDHLIFFGRLETRKGLHIFCDAIRQLQKEAVALPTKISFLGKYAMVQGRTAEDYLEEFSNDFPAVDIQIINDFDYVQALTYIRDSRGLVVICPILDNYPLAVVETIQNKLPFLAATTGGIPEMVDEQITFEPNVASLVNCLKNRSIIDHTVIRHKYSSSQADNSWCELHDELIASSNAALDGDMPTAKGIMNYQPVSVCIPFFNHSQYLESLVMAFSRQNYPTLEIILVNDGSGPTGSMEFDRLKRNSRDDRFKFLTTENHGPGATRNHAAKSASGDYLLFFDADNVPKDSGFVSTLVRAIERSGADCVTCPYDIVGPDKVLVTEKDVVATYRPFGPCLEAGFFENILGDSTMIIRRSAFEALGGFPIQRASWEDHEFLLELCFCGFKLETYPEATFFYRKSPGGRNLQANEFQNYQSLFERLQLAKSGDLARILAAVAGPMLLARFNSASQRFFAR